MKYLNKKFLLFLSIISFTTLLISFFYAPAPKLTTSTPANNSNLDNLNSPIILEFNQKVELDNFSFQLDPSEDFNVSSSSNRVLLTFTKPFPINKHYLLTIAYKNKKLDETVSFTTNVPKSTQFDARFNQDIQSELETQYPLMAKTPYENADYRIVYSSPLTLEISIKNKNLSKTDALSSVKSWVTKNGGDSLSHNYVIAPTLQAQ